MRRFAPLLVAVAGLSLASQVEIPAQPVPFTLQTLGVILVGFVLGPALGFAATAAWLLAGGLGLPVFSGGGGGLDSFTGPTGGYLLAFPFAAALVGWIADRGVQGFSVPRFLAAGLAAHALTLAVGGAWLSTSIGAAGAWEKGVLPFLLSAVLKSVAAVIVMKAAALAGARD